MAGFVLSKASGFADSIYGNSAAPISMILEQSLEAFERESVASKIFSSRKTNKYADKLTALSAMDGFLPTGENGAYPDTDFAEVFSKIVESVTWKNRFTVTREMVEDAQFDVMRIRAKKFAQSYSRTREVYAAEMLAGATGTSITFGGKKFDTTSADGVAMFSTQHPNYFKPSKKQSNLYAGAFSASVLGELETVMQNFTGDKDEILALAPDTIIIPNIASLKNDVFAAIGADKDPATSNNGFNYQYGRWNVIISPYWRPTGSDKPFILMDSKFNELDGTALMYDRLPLSCEAYEDKNTDAAVYKGRARFVAAFNNWRGMLMGGVSTGTTL